MDQGIAKLELIDLMLNYPKSGEHPENGRLDVSPAVDLRGPHGAPPIRISATEFTVLLGPSGCGKSSLLRMIAGLVQPTRGEVRKDGQPINGPGKDRGMVFQSYTSFPWLTVEENVLFALQLQRVGRRERKSAVQRQYREKAREIIELVNLTEALNKYPSELSGGMKQRVAIARALVNDPDVLLMDEPFGALDPHIRVKMQELVLKIEETLKTTIIFVTHDAREAVFLGDTIYISTLRPCFLKYRIKNPFNKEEMPRAKARARYENDFLRFQLQVEGLMHDLIQHPDIARSFEKEDTITFERSTLGVLEELSD